MKQKNQTHLSLALCLLAAFALWTLAVRSVDVQAIGPQGSAVGFAAVNQSFQTRFVKTMILKHFVHLLYIAMIRKMLSVNLTKTQWLKNSMLNSSENPVAIKHTKFYTQLM